MKLHVATIESGKVRADRLIAGAPGGAAPASHFELRECASSNQALTARARTGLATRSIFSSSADGFNR
jgi:hypothetical protein